MAISGPRPGRPGWSRTAVFRKEPPRRAEPAPLPRFIGNHAKPAGSHAGFPFGHVSVGRSAGFAPITPPATPDLDTGIGCPGPVAVRMRVGALLSLADRRDAGRSSNLTATSAAPRAAINDDPTEGFLFNRFLPYGLTKMSATLMILALVGAAWCFLHAAGPEEDHQNATFSSNSDESDFEFRRCFPESSRADVALLNPSYYSGPLVRDGSFSGETACSFLDDMLSPKYEKSDSEMSQPLSQNR
ncbi:hypothetical protein EES40_35695 [Streptomyces sp. ADI93-02]|nr:hypothetical protein EES40_35695 [Streptomyces sp. ADI93-02]